MRSSRRRAGTSIAASASLAAAAALLLSGCGSKTTTTSGTARAGSGEAKVQVATGSLGMMLVDGSGRSLYLWLGDHSSTSSCYDQCATFWPPLLTTHSPQPGGGTQGDLLGASLRNDGTTQVTYAGHPLYYFKADRQPGDTLGQGQNGFHATWWLVAADGTAITVPLGAPSSAPASSKPKRPNGYRG